MRTMTRRSRPTPGFKAKVALAVIKDGKPPAEVAQRNESLHGALGKARLLSVMVAALAGLFAATPTRAQEIATYILDINQGSGLTQIVQSLEGDSYELADGTKVSFLKWYHTDWIDLRIDMLTQLSDNFGILWGASTGEWGEKFNIEPSLKLGVIAQTQPRPNSTLSLSVSTIIGGRLTEYPCQADYGAIGGTQTVNCRLAASELAPRDTLQYLLNTEPNRLSISVSYSARF